MSAVSPLPESPDALDPTEQRWHDTATQLAAGMANIKTRWGIENPPLFMASQVNWRAFHATADCDFIAGPAEGCTVMADLKDKEGYVITLGGNSILLPIVSHGGTTLLGVMLTDDFNNYWRDS